MTAVTTKQRCKYLDIAKALAIILMVFLHISPDYGLFTKIINTFHMAVFFIISGVFFNPRNDNFLSFLKKSVLQLLVPYFLFSIIALSICWISPYLHPEIYKGLNTFTQIFKAAIIGIFIGQDNFNGYAFMPLGPLWFLLALFWCRLAMYIWLQKSKFKYFIRAAIILVCAGIFLYQPMILSLNGMAVSFPFVLIGFYAKDIFRSLNTYKLQIRLIVFIVCIAALFIFTDSAVAFGGGSIHGNIFLAYLRGLCGSIALILLCTFIERMPKLSAALAVMGASTLTILCLHFHFLYPSKVIYKLIGGDPGKIDIITAFIITLITVFCLTYVHKFLQAKAPILIGRKKK